MVASIAAMDDLPGSLRLTSTFPFVGRSSELDTLRALLPRAAGEGRRVVLLGGEAGSGKSRLVREFAAEAAREGVLVLYGACDAVVRTPYGPFVQALDHLARAAGDARILLLATFRDSEADVPELLSDTLADLRRSDDVVRLRLGALSGEEVDEFVGRAAGADLDPELRELARAIRDLTEGN